MANRGNGFGILLVFLLDLLGSAASNMEPIYWNSLNERCDCAWPPRCGARHGALNEGLLSAVGGFTQQGAGHGRVIFTEKLTAGAFEALQRMDCHVVNLQTSRCMGCFEVRPSTCSRPSTSSSHRSLRLREQSPRSLNSSPLRTFLSPPPPPFCSLLPLHSHPSHPSRHLPSASISASVRLPAPAPPLRRGEQT
ncbi:unnamed protein product [Pleuronectes platessa]|uniref:Uncharacterized protein n=1 Tax=Pleuronectes platessa TaxID=8262 RepID=A0A9N7UC34_PLEPL|nr:unnamed protein product [Pleuronectes platessa]